MLQTEVGLDGLGALEETCPDMLAVVGFCVCSYYRTFPPFLICQVPLSGRKLQCRTVVIIIAVVSRELIKLLCRV